MKKIILTLSFAIFVLLSFSQQNNAEAYDWELKPTSNTAVFDTSLHAIYLVHKTIKEYIYEENQLKEFYLIHKRIKLFTHKAVENFNTVYIPQYHNSEIILEKARVITKNGEVLNLDESAIKEGKDEDSDTEFRYFAFEGVDVGCEIEYLYILKKKPYHSGTHYNVQLRYPIYNYGFDLYAPLNLHYQFKSFNEFPTFEIDTAYKEANYWHVEMDTIPELKKEDMANYNADIMAFGFKLHNNTYNGLKDITSYGSWSKDAYESIYNIEKKEKAAIKKIIKEINIDKSSEEKTIRSIEDYLKKNYAYYEVSTPALSDLPKIYLNKAFNENGSIFVYANIFQELGIKHELVVTTDRWDNRFDEEFESYTYLEKFLFYIPACKKYMSSSDVFSRLGFPPQEHVNNYGLFIKEVSMGEFSSAVGKVKFIPDVEMEKTKNRLKVEVKFQEDFSTTELNIVHEYTGYDAYYYQPVFQLIKDEEQLEDFRKEIVNIFDIEEDAESYEFINDDGASFGIKPLIVKSKFITGHFTEKAGDTYLFRLGQLIGPQMELYEEKERKEDFEFRNSRIYYRDIIIEIPEGYVVNNLDKLQFDKNYQNENNDTVFAFISDYKIEENKLIITMTEWYNGLNFEKEIWNEYREIVNAAANFNKINIFFTKNGK